MGREGERKGRLRKQSSENWVRKICQNRKQSTLSVFKKTLCCAIQGPGCHCLVPGLPFLWLSHGRHSLWWEVVEWAWAGHFLSWFPFKAQSVFALGPDLQENFGRALKSPGNTVAGGLWEEPCGLNEKSSKELACEAFSSITEGISSSQHFDERVSPPLPTPTCLDNINCQALVWKPPWGGEERTAALEVFLGRMAGRSLRICCWDMVNA